MASSSPLPPMGPVFPCASPHRGGFTLEQLADAQTVDEPCVRLLRRIIASRSSLLVTGATGSGKTTVLGALLGAVSPRERIVIVEGHRGTATPAPARRALAIAAPPISKEPDGSPCEISCVSPCECDPIGSSSAKFVEQKSSICSLP